MEKLTVVKIGGNVLDDSSALQAFIQEFNELRGLKILVHGGGKKATELSEKLGIESTMLHGRRQTNAAALEVVSMVYAGLINKHLVAKLQSLSMNAFGLSGADGNVLKAKLRPVKDFDFGWVGDLDDSSVNIPLIKNLLQEGLIPVFCAITHDGEGQLLNTNADTIAAQLALSLASFYEVQLIYCFEKAGVLRDVDDESSVISNITTELFDILKAEKIISLGMLPKVENALHCVKGGVREVKITQALDFSNRKKGTSIVLA